MISALFEPEVDINVEVSTACLTKKLSLSNATPVMTLKSQICNAFKYAVQFKTMQLRFGGEILNQNLPIHFYGIIDSCQLEVVKPYIGVKIENNHGNAIYWRLHKKETIKEVKVRLASAKSASSMATRKLRHHEEYSDYGDSDKIVSEVKIDGVSAEGTCLYIITEDRFFKELDDDEIVENYKIKDGDNLYLLTYRWVINDGNVTLMKTGAKIWGVEPDDTCLGIKLRVQDQLGIPVSDVTLYQGDKKEIKYYFQHSLRFQHNVRKAGFTGNSKPLPRAVGDITVITEEELQAEEARIKMEHLKKQAKQEEARLERERRIQNQKEEQARKQEEARLEREKQIQKQKEDQAIKTELCVRGGRRIQKP